MREGAHALARREMCLPERFHTPQDGVTPLLVAVNRGHAAVVEKLLAAGAATDVHDDVRDNRCG